MKTRVLLGTLLVAVAACAAVMPRFVESSIPTAYYIKPDLKTYENIISCSGTIHSNNVRQIVPQSVLVAEEVYVEVGDIVTEGSPLLRVDNEQTKRMNLPVNFIRDITNDADAFESSNIDWAALASQYGLSAAVNGDVDTAALESLLRDQGLSATSYAATMISGTEDGDITAPIAGVVTSVEVQKEVPTSAGSAIITISDNQSYKVLVAIREEDVGHIQQGDQANIRGVGFSGAVYTGVVTKIYPTARKMFSGTTSETVVDAEISLENPDERLKPGFSAKVEILGGNDYNLITVPYEAIKQDENNKEYVYLYEDGKLKKQLIVTGQELTDEVEILEGVSYDSVVVYNPSDAIKEGEMVNIKGRANVG